MHSIKLPHVTRHQRRLLRWLIESKYPYIYALWHDEASSRLTRIRTTASDAERLVRRSTLEDLLVRGLVSLENDGCGARIWIDVFVTDLGKEVLGV